MAPLALAVCLGLASFARAQQRVQFPTMVEDPGMAGSAATPWTSAQPVSPPGGFDPYAVPMAQPSLSTPAPAFQPPPSYTTPAPYAAPTAAPYNPYAPSPYSPAPYGAQPYSPTPGALYPEGVQMPQSNFSFGEPLRFMQAARLRWTWLAPIGNTDNFLGVNDVETNASFQVPMFSTASPLVLTPGFAIHFWEGPVTTPPANLGALPPNTYDAYLDGGWYPTITPWLSAQVGVRVGVYTDFNTFTTQSIRYMGRGLGVITFTPTLQFALGVVYIDRVVVKLLPAGGLIWTPNPDARYEILFPNPKLARRLTTRGNTDIWIYANGEYGGGSWTADQADGQFDYNDIRFGGGIETFGMRGLHAYFEVAYAFDRELVYRSGTPTFNAADTVMLRAGISY